jgi:hypothetical protein
VQVLGKFKHARLCTPERASEDLEIYPVQEDTGVDLARLDICAAIELFR